MKKLLALSVALISSLVSADVHVDFQLNMANKEIVNHCIFKDEAQSWSFEEQGIVVQVTILPEEDGVIVNCKLSVTNENGEVILVAEPMIKTTWGEVAKIEVKNEAGEDFKMQIVATNNQN